jgi:hypothetical protein
VLALLGSLEGSREAVVIALEPHQHIAKCAAHASQVLAQRRQLFQHPVVPLLV